MPDRPIDVLRSLFDRILRPSDYPDAWTTAGASVTREIQTEPRFAAGLRCLDAEAAAVFGQGFCELHALQQDELLDRIELDQVRTRWDEAGAEAWLSAVVNVIGRAYTESSASGGTAGEAGA